MKRFSRPSGWALLVPVVALAAGLLFATSGSTAQGNDLRGGEVSELRGLIAERQRTGELQEQQLRDLQAQVEDLTDQAAGRNSAVAAAQQAGRQGEVSAALVPLTGPGLRITLDDAPQGADGTRPHGATADDLVIHQSDVQAVVNALWAAAWSVSSSTCAWRSRSCCCWSAPVRCRSAIRPRSSETSPPRRSLPCAVLLEVAKSSPAASATTGTSSDHPEGRENRTPTPPAPGKPDRSHSPCG